jgi:hypothetical protein
MAKDSTRSRAVRDAGRTEWTGGTRESVEERFECSRRRGDSLVGTEGAPGRGDCSPLFTVQHSRRGTREQLDGGTVEGQVAEAFCQLVSVHRFSGNHALSLVVPF